MDDLVSIVIPCWNGADFVAEAIDSALAQTYPHVEVVVIDDGSTDRSLEVVRSYGERVRWETGPNRGGAAARNRGVNIARGRWIQFLDADDLLLENKLCLQVEKARGLDPSTTTITLGTVEGSDFLAGQYLRVLAEGADSVCFAVGGVLQTAAPLHTRESLLRVGGFDESLPCAQEFDLHLRLVCSGTRLAQIPVNGFHVRRRPGSVSADGTRVVRQMRYVLGRARDQLVGRGELDAARSAALARAMGRAANHLEVVGAKEESAALWAMAQELLPGVELAIWRPAWRPLVRVIGNAHATRLRRRMLHVLGRGGRRETPSSS